jgi:hypothetical protein
LNDAASASGISMVIDLLTPSISFVDSDMGELTRRSGGGARLPGERQRMPETLPNQPARTDHSRWTVPRELGGPSPGGGPPGGPQRGRGTGAGERAWPWTGDPDPLTKEAAERLNAWGDDQPTATPTRHENVTATTTGGWPWGDNEDASPGP